MLNVTYKGKSYAELDNVLMKSIVERTTEHYASKLQPFSEEIIACGGEVHIDVPEDLVNVTISLSNMPDDLQTRVSQALGETV
jgi:hypothetical protein